MTDFRTFSPIKHFFSSDSELIPDPADVDEKAIPEPYRHLLVHSGDMTSRLEAFHKTEITLDPIKVDHLDNTLFREVLLKNTSGDPVEYGIIEINLNAFAPDIKAEIIEGKKPLGALLNKYAIPYTSSPLSYFHLTANEHVVEMLGSAPGDTLYGRCNILSNEGNTLASIIEILPKHNHEKGI